MSASTGNSLATSLSAKFRMDSAEVRSQISMLSWPRGFSPLSRDSAAAPRSWFRAVNITRSPRLLSARANAYPIPGSRRWSLPGGNRCHHHLSLVFRDPVGSNTSPENRRSRIVRAVHSDAATNPARTATSPYSITGIQVILRIGHRRLQQPKRLRLGLELPPRMASMADRRHDSQLVRPPDHTEI